MDIITAIAAASQGLDILKTLRELDRSIDKVEWRAKIAEVQNLLTDAKLALAEAKDTIGARETEIARLRKALQRKEETIEHDGFPYTRGPDGKPRGRAFCPACIEKFGQFFRLNRTVHGGLNQYMCPNCKTPYGVRVHAFLDD